MGDNSKIEWCDATFNPWLGCTKVGPGCDNCYAEAWGKRTAMIQWGNVPRRHTSEQTWHQPVKWNRAALSEGVRRRVFCASLADVFDNTVPRKWRQSLFNLIRQTPHLDWLLLTKRIGNVREMLPIDWGNGYQNVWLGATVVTQEEADRDIPKLQHLNAAVRFLSIEPMLEAINLEDHVPDVPGAGSSIGWIICGGESGHAARPMREAWAADLRAQCKDAGIAFFMKQGSRANWPHFKDFSTFNPYIQVREFPNAARTS